MSLYIDEIKLNAFDGKKQNHSLTTEESSLFYDKRDKAARKIQRQIRNLWYRKRCRKKNTERMEKGKQPKRYALPLFTEQFSSQNSAIIEILNRNIPLWKKEFNKLKQENEKMETSWVICNLILKNFFYYNYDYEIITAVDEEENLQGILILDPKATLEEEAIEVLFLLTAPHNLQDKRKIDGIGTALLEMAIHNARKKNRKVVVQPAKSALTFYEERGWEEIKKALFDNSPYWRLPPKKQERFLNKYAGRALWKKTNKDG